MAKYDYTGWRNRPCLRIKIGGSHRQLARQVQAFKIEGIPIETGGSFSLGSKFSSGRIPDTQEAKDLLKSVKGTIAKDQYNFWREGEPYGKD
jgi:hypothetical protein